MREPTRGRPRRSELATPASDEHMCEVAARAGADMVFLDLEDACAPAAKESARAIAVAALTQLDWGDTIRAIRINGLDTKWCYGDIVEVLTGARDALDVIIVPKVLTAREVWWVDVLLTQLEEQLELTHPIALEALIEEAEGLLNAQEIARSSPRLEAIIFGAGDLSASLRSRVDGNFQPVGDYPGDFWHAVRLGVSRRRPCSRRRGDRRAVSRLSGRRRLPPGRDARESARFRRQVGDPSRSGPGRQRGVQPVRRRGRRGAQRSSQTIATPRPRELVRSGAAASLLTPL